MKKPIAVHIYEILCRFESFIAELIDRMLCLESVAEYFYREEVETHPPLKVQTTVYPPPATETLKDLLNQALEMENYELAVELRDKLNKQ